jgi:hypothetical protein
MEATKIQERNEQIALMLGMKMQETYVTNWKKFDYLLNSIEDTLKFHSDWNWLMEAVEFIENLDLNDIFTMPEFNYHVGKMTLLRVNKDVLKKMPITSKKEAVFIAVSDFAKLYNNKEL